MKLILLNIIAFDSGHLELSNFLSKRVDDKQTGKYLIVYSEVI